MPFFDTHAHLNDAQFDVDRDELLRSCLERGVVRIIEIADSPADWEKAVALSRARPFIRCALGLHPYYAAEWNERLETELLRRSRLPEVVAVGEIGLDYVKSGVSPETQRASFLRMLELSWDCRLPAVLHCRGAFADMMPLLRDFYAGKAPAGRFHGVLHCFAGDTQDALEAKRLGFALGVDGPITYPKNGPLREAIAAAGLDSVVLETDSPYLPPQSCRGHRNDPRALPEIASRVASVFGISPEEVERASWDNALALYRLDGSGHKLTLPTEKRS